MEDTEFRAPAGDPLPADHVAAIEGADVVSFDLFDTLVVRVVARPRDVFLWMERELAAAHGPRMQGFAAARFAAELEVARDTWAPDRGAEFTLADVYRRLGEAYPTFLRSASADELLALELRAERHACRRHPRHGDLFDAAIAAGRRVVIATDIYLPEDHVEGVLRDAGYAGWAALYVSNDRGTNKASGGLFAVMLDDLGVPADRIVHFGDSERSDVEQAQAAGLRAVHVSRGDHLLRGLEPTLSACADVAEPGLTPLDSSSFVGVQQVDASRAAFGASADVMDVARDIGFRVLGPMGYAFACWVADEALVRGIDRLYFVAREGWFLKRLYEAVAPAIGCEVPADYFYASRRVLRMAVASAPFAESALDVLGGAGPAGEFLEAMGLPLSDDVLEQYGIGGAGAEVKRADLLPLFQAHEGEIAALCSEERQDYLAYVEQVGMTASAHSGLVDSGWYGSSQRALTAMLRGAGCTTRLTGLYLGVSPRGRENFTDDSAAVGFLYHFFHPDIERDTRPFADLARMIELLLTAPSPSVRRMRRGADGRVEPVFVRDPEGSALHPACEAMQQGALAFVEAFATVLPGDPPRLSLHFARELVESLIRNPSKARAECLGQMPYDKSSFNAETDHTFLPSREERARAFRAGPGELWRQFSDSNWRQGYLASLDSGALRQALLTGDPALWSPDDLPARLYDRLRRGVRRVLQRP